MSALRTALAAAAPGVRVALMLAALILLAFAATRMGFRWDPFGLAERRLERAEARAVAAEVEAMARTLKAEGERGQQTRLEGHNRTVEAAKAGAAVVIQHSGAADDASEPLDPARADRLRAHDRELCRLVPDLDGCPASADPG